MYRLREQLRKLSRLLWHRLYVNCQRLFRLSGGLPFLQRLLRLMREQL